MGARRAHGFPASPSDLLQSDSGSRRPGPLTFPNFSTKTRWDSPSSLHSGPPANTTPSMDNVNYQPRMTMALEREGTLAREAFVLIDVGCSGGIDALWRSFGAHLRAYGLDPDVAECRRLQSLEANPRIRYFPVPIGLPDDSEFLRSKNAYERANSPYEHSVMRRSTNLDTRFRTPSTVAGQGVPAEFAETARVGLTEFLRQQELPSVDFVKVDTDGHDLEVLLSGEPSIENAQIMGFLVECMYQGSDHDTSNTFHNIDRFMKRHGFMIYGMTINKYSRAVLPAPFVYQFPAQTTSGQPAWGDVVFLRDLAAPELRKYVADFSAEKIIKLACLYEIFQVPDCAVELILQHRDKISGRADVTKLLDLLTPPLAGTALSYQEYVQAVTANPKVLFPNK